MREVIGQRAPTPARVRRAAQRWLHRAPQGASAGRLSTALAAGVARWARRRAARPRPRATVPTIVVGALSVGGAGKTPVVEALARRLAPRRVVIVGHGYGGRARSETLRVDGPDAERFGDEAAALWRSLAGMDVAIVLGPSRAVGQRWAERHLAPDVILVDDGFQDPALPRTVDLVVVDAAAGHRVMPAGPLREPLSALSRADAVWLHKVDEPGARSLAGVEPLVTSRAAPRAVRLPDGRRVGPDWLAGRALRPLCAIGRPASFAHTLTVAGARLLPGCTRADHHRFGADELARLPAGPWITTTKDHARLPPSFAAAVLEIELELIDGAAALDAALSRWLRGAP